MEKHTDIWIPIKGQESVVYYLLLTKVITLYICALLAFSGNYIDWKTLWIQQRPVGVLLKNGVFRSK